MPVLTFDPQKTNFIRQGGTAYFLTCLDGRTPVLVPSACPHRGGPLHLGTLDLDRGTVTCPWHDIAVSVRRLQRSAMPLVYRKDRATAVLQDGGAEQPVASTVVVEIR